MDYYEWLHHGRKAQLKWAAWSCTIGMKLQLKHVEAGEEDEVEKKVIKGKTLHKSGKRHDVEI